MARNPDRDSVFVFDLVEHDAADAGVPLATSLGDDTGRAGGVDDGDPRAGELPRSSRWLSGGWRAAAPAAAVLAIVIGTGFASDGMRDGARLEQMRDVVGGVADLAVPLEETWVWEGEVGGGPNRSGQEDMVGVLGRLLVFESDGELVALEPGTGKEAWVVPLGDDAECGPMGGSLYVGPLADPVSAVVCLQGRATDREAVLVRSDGEVPPARALDPGDTRRYGAPRPGPDGTVLRATRVGPELKVDLGDATCDASTGECSGMVEAGRDVELRAEDAVTGEARWSVTAPFRAADPGQCWRTEWEDLGNIMTFDGSIYPDAFGAWITTDLVNLHGCGVGAAVTPEGAVLGTAAEWGMAEVESLGADRYARVDYGRETRTLVYSGDGTVTGEFPGQVAGPRVADGSGPAMLLGTDQTGQRLRAYAADGTRLWDIGGFGADRPYLAQVGETAVVDAAVEGVDVRGLDVATGAERWRWDGSADGDGVFQVFTDGRSVLLLLIDYESGASEMVSLDAATGEVLWREGGRHVWDDSGRPGTVATLMAVDGHLLEVAGDGVRGLG